MQYWAEAPDLLEGGRVTLEETLLCFSYVGYYPFSPTTITENYVRGLKGLHKQLPNRVSDLSRVEGGEHGSGGDELGLCSTGVDELHDEVEKNKDISIHGKWWRTEYEWENPRSLEAGDESVPGARRHEILRPRSHVHPLHPTGSKAEPEAKVRWWRRGVRNGGERHRETLGGAPRWVEGLQERGVRGVQVMGKWSTGIEINPEANEFSFGSGSPHSQSHAFQPEGASDVDRAIKVRVSKWFPSNAL
ncbi:hypothetical protein B0H14DRAFT_2634440 [Mycena olivaceomarginata]|nr:hypothetical protein B0H14DRAFT_2634440 [Mycena olivaceomarginata]